MTILCMLFGLCQAQAVNVLNPEDCGKLGLKAERVDPPAIKTETTTISPFSYYACK